MRKQRHLVAIYPFSRWAALQLLYKGKKKSPFIAQDNISGSFAFPKFSNTQEFPSELTYIHYYVLI